tara:strand:- start:57 stop:581 length:525 start_codon:yes stop_codon:yes gene_type:complete
MTSILGTQSIQHPNGTSAATVDAGGRILTPARPSFHARKGHSSGVSGEQGTIIFDEVDHNIGNHYNTSNGRFTAPVSGIYYFCFDSLVATDASGGALGDGESINVKFIKNGAEGTFSQRTYSKVSGATTFSTMHRVDCIQLNATDYIQVNVAAQFIYYDNSGYYDATFQGFLIG